MIRKLIIFSIIQVFIFLFVAGLMLEKSYARDRYLAPPPPMENDEAGESEITTGMETQGDADKGRMLFMGEEKFEYGGPPCISCHSAGKDFVSGRVSAPDMGTLANDSSKKSILKYEWVNNQISHIKKSVYPSKKVTEAEINYIRSFLLKSEKELEEYNIGLDLFTGGKAFTNGGPPCTSCHSAGKWESGTGAVIDLMLPNEKYGVGPAYENPLIAAAWINSSGTPVMGHIYSRMNVTDDEVEHLKDFFDSLGNKSDRYSLDSNIGRMLFNGELPFMNGGTACIYCHSLGKGIKSIRVPGPDLRDIYHTTKKSFLNKESVNNSKVHIKKPVYSNKNIIKEEADYIKSFLKVTEKELAEYKIGYDLFTGGSAYANGGPPCISCHSAGKWASGGGVATDLIYGQNFMGGTITTNPLMAAAWINSPGTPVMGPIYSMMNLTDEEVDHLKAFFKSLMK